MGRRPRAAAPDVLDALTESGDYRERLDLALASVKGLAGTPDAYLYVADPGGRRFHLEHTSARPAADPTRAAPGPMEQTMEGGAEWSVPTPPFEIAAGEADARPRVVTSPVGSLYSFPLTTATGSVVGLVQTGPVGGGSVPSRVRNRYEELRSHLTLVVAQTRREEELRARLASATAQLEASRRLAGSAVDVERLVGLLLDLALASTRTEAGFVAISSEQGQLEVRAAAGMPPGFAESVDLTPETGLLDWSAAEGGALFLRDLEAAEAMGLRSLLAVPLMEGADALGVFALVNFGEAGTFDEQSLELLEAFSEQIRLMLHNARLFGSFAERYLGTVQGLARALDARRAETHGHHEAVSGTATAIAREAGLDEDEVEAVRIAGLIHDVGIAGSPEGAWESDVEHPTVGASLVAHLPLHPAVAPAVATHHEWFDGWGFPSGLRGDEIVPAGRALALAEFLVELATPDDLRPGWPAERLTAELEQRSGSQFDPQIAQAATRLLTRDGLPLLAMAGRR